eukprot:TRINITY_DN9552_c0_g4_i1.p1 TRINITY_DN9552_c0_g4~~TRINITY_DN9552_c0_g4_i1.p1  ORF type:complete len:204 (+),score=69.37 TRINITY_DN9552_c0_g4_i1:373-984(+)
MENMKVEKVPDTPRATPADHDMSDYQDKDEKALFIKELEKKVRRLSESQEVAEGIQEEGGKRKPQKQKESPLKKKKIESHKDIKPELSNAKLAKAEEIANEVLSGLNTRTSKRQQQKKKQETRKEQRPKRQANEVQEDDLVNYPEAQEAHEPKKQTRIPKEQKKGTKEKAKKVKPAKKKSVKNVEANEAVSYTHLTLPTNREV